MLKRLLALAVLLLVASPAFATWTVDGIDYTLRKKITIDNTNVDSDLTDFPLLVKIVDDADIGAVSNADGFDHRFTASDGSTVLKFERESFAISGGEADAVYWVKVPTVAGSSDTDIYIYYRADDTADGSDAANTWDSNFAAVWHMGDGGSNSVIAPDSKNGYTGTKTSAGHPVVSTTSVVGNAQNRDGTYKITTNFTPSGAIFTFSAFVRTAQTGGTNAFAACDGNPLVMAHAFQSGTDWKPALYNSDKGAYNTFGLGNYSSNTYVYVAFTRAGNSVTNGYSGFLNGTKGGTQYNTGTWSASSALLLLGSGYGNDYTGYMDEVRWSTVVRSDAWIKFEYYNMSAADNEIAFGSEEESSASSRNRIIIIS